jgi:rare lipoprotein A
MLSSRSTPSIDDVFLVAKQAHQKIFCGRHCSFVHDVTVPLPFQFRTVWSGGSKNMSSISFSGPSRQGFGANCALTVESRDSFADVWKAFQLCSVALTAITLAACAQSSGFTDKSALAPGRQSSLEYQRKSSFVSNGHRALAAKGQAPSAVHENSKDAQDASHGLASFYGSDSQTASGEKFDAHEFTAAHRTLPFGTRVRVTNHSNGRSVVVTINDRGPFVRGRIIDVTPAAAHALGMSGLASVTVERE